LLSSNWTNAKVMHREELSCFCWNWTTGKLVEETRSNPEAAGRMGDEKRTRRQFSSEDKAGAVKHHLVGGEAVSAICEDLGVAPNLFYRWQKELFDHTAPVFEVKGRDKR